MKVLVTGGAGYIGSAAVEKLIDRGNEVVILDSLWRGHAGAAAPGSELLKVDLRDAAAVKAALVSTRPDAVMHFAAATIVPESVAQPGDYFAINTVGSHNLLEAMRAADVRRFVFSSTAAVYGVPDEIPVRESTTKAPINPYGVSKWIVEQMLPAYRDAYGLQSVVFRYFNVAGATSIHGEDHDPETHVIPVALQTLLGKRPSFSIFGDDYPTGDGTAVRDYVHVLDLVDAHLLALDRIDEDFGVFNLGSRSGFSVKEIVDAVERATGRTLPITRAPRRAGDPPVLVADSSRAQNVLGWKPARSTLDEMIGSAWDWMRRHPDGYRQLDSKLL